MTYIRNSWGNKAKPVDASLVKKVREETEDRLESYTAEDLK